MSMFQYGVFCDPFWLTCRNILDIFLYLVFYTNYKHQHSSSLGAGKVKDCGHFGQNRRGIQLKNGTLEKTFDGWYQMFYLH